MESIEIDLPAREKKPLVIDGTEYLISPYIDINDMSLLANCEEENDCRSAIVRCILLRINPKEKSLHPDLESFVRKSDATITEFCKLIVESDEVFRKYYTNQSEEISTFWTTAFFCITAVLLRALAFIVVCRLNTQRTHG